MVSAEPVKASGWMLVTFLRSRHSSPLPANTPLPMLVTEV